MPVNLYCGTAANDKKISVNFNKDNTISYNDEGTTKAGTFEFLEGRFDLFINFSGTYFFVGIWSTTEYRVTQVKGDLFYKFESDEKGKWYTGFMTTDTIPRRALLREVAQPEKETKKLIASARDIPNWMVGDQKIYQKWDDEAEFKEVIFNFKSDGTFSTKNEAIVLSGRYLCEGFFVRIYCDNGIYYKGMLGNAQENIEGNMVTALRSGDFRMAFSWGRKS